MYMKDFKCTSINLFIFTILINFTMEIVFINIMQCNSIGIKFLFNAKLSKWTCVCSFYFKIATRVLA